MADDHTLSPAYAENFIDVLDEATAYKDQVINMFLHLRRKKVDAMIENLLEMFKEEGAEPESVDLMMEYLTELNDLKRQIAAKLGNSVSRI
jgi:hypothetical protein